MNKVVFQDAYSAAVGVMGCVSDTRILPLKP